MDYTSPTTARMSEPRPGASCRAVVEISECKTYTSQRLDSLRRSDFALYKGAIQPDHIHSSSEFPIRQAQLWQVMKKVL